MSRIFKDLAAHHARSSGASHTFTRSSSQISVERAPHVAIVGAGLSGLRCADFLLQCGAKVTILEARNRTGGRVHQIKNDNHLVDLGPNWIHGTAGNPILQIAEKVGAVTVEAAANQTIVDADGNHITGKQSLERGSEVWATIVDAFKYSNERHASINPQESLMDYFRKEVPKRFPEDSTKVQEILKDAAMWGAFVGDSIETQSLRCFFLEQCLDGENLFVASSYKDVLAVVERRAAESADIRLGEEVVSIAYREADDHRGKVHLTVKSGDTAEFDEVVVTCPLGWLKRNTTAFTPALPPRLVKAIENIGYGRLEKLYISFPSAFWIQTPPKDESPVVSAKLLSESSLKEQEFTFTHFQHPNYHPDPVSKTSRQWNVEVASLAELPASTSHPTLLFYLYGECGTHLTSLLAQHAPHSKAYNEILHEFAFPYFSKFANYSSTNPDCEPTSFLFTAWQNDPFAGHGSYSNFQVGLKDGDLDIQVMRNADGLSDAGRGIWLAGEHTAPFVALGTTTGAYWSGEAVARRIAEAYHIDAQEGTTVCNTNDQPIKAKEPKADSMDGANMNGLAL